MKRTELVKKLEKFAESNQYFDLRDQYPDLIAGDIIRFLESEGMLAPLVKEPVDSYIEIPDWGAPQYNKVDGSFAFVSKWEDETEG